MSDLKFFHAHCSIHVDVIIVASDMNEAWEYLAKLKRSYFKNEHLDNLTITEKIEYLKDNLGYQIYKESNIYSGAYLRIGDGVQSFEYRDTLR